MRGERAELDYFLRISDSARNTTIGCGRNLSAFGSKTGWRALVVMSLKHPLDTLQTFSKLSLPERFIRYYVPLSHDFFAQLYD